MTEQEHPEERRSGRARRGHPENDLTSDFDHTNRPFPEAQSPEELSESPDPARVAAQNRKSGYQALWYAIAAPICLIVVGFLLLVLSRLVGGPLCEAGEANWICTEFVRIWWPIATSVLAFLVLIGCAVIMVRKLNRHLRWWPWMAAFWFLVPMMMLWMTTTLPIAITGGSLIF